MPVTIFEDGANGRLNNRIADPFDVGNAGAPGDGVADAYLAFRNAAQTLGTSGSIYVPPGTYRIGTNLTIACGIIFANGATVKPDSGVTLTLSGPVQTVPNASIIASGTAGTVSVTGPVNGVAELNVKTFGAVGDGVADDTAAIQRALDAADDAGGGVVFLPAGTYQLSTRLFAPYGADLAYCLSIGSNVTLAGAGVGATTLLGPVFTIGNTAGYSGSWRHYAIMTTRPNDVSTFENIALRDFTYDGQANLQTILPPGAQHGIYMGRARGVWHTDVIVKNIYGLSSAPPQETFCFSAEDCADVHYVNCQAFGDDGGDTSTGFSIAESVNVVYSNCIARDLTFGMGFTTFQSSGVTYSSCRAYNCGEHGFNTEISSDITYASCQSGGVSAEASVNPFFGNTESLGNGSNGFMVLGSKRVTILSCVSTYNGLYGFRADLYTPTTPDTPSVDVIISGCVIAYNVTKGMWLDGGTQARVTIDPSNIVFNNGASSADNWGSIGVAADNRFRYARTPIEIITALDATSGVQYVVQGSSADTQFRWFKNGSVGFGTQLFALTDDGAMAIPDGITAPAALTGMAKIYVDAADGDLKVRFADGTIKTIVTDT